MDEPSTTGAGFPVMCSVCGYEFQLGEEYYVLQRTTLKKLGGVTNFVQITNERIMCMNECNAEDFVEA